MHLQIRYACRIDNPVINNNKMRKNVVVTGGAQGIGKIVSLYLLQKGYCVTVWDNDKEALGEMVEENKQPDLRLDMVDVSDEEQVKSALQKSVGKFGRIDGLVNNAMIAANKPISELGLDEWNKVLAVNLTGPFLCVKYAVEELKKTHGVIINMCSTRTLQSEPNTEAYTTAKGGLLSMTHALAMSLGPQVRVNAISPGWIDVSAIRKKSAADQYPLSEADHQQHPAGRVGKGQDVANMIYFLLQPENDFITGQNFVIDGGMTKKMIYIE